MKPFPEIRNCELYLCGGAVRDYLLGVPNKDEDYVVMTDLTYGELVNQLESDGIKIFKKDPEFFTIRCFIENRPIDLVYPRKEGGYSDGRHPDSVERVLTLAEDAVRRDFTINAMYMNKDFKILDFYQGQKDLDSRVIKTVSNPRVTFEDDYLRILRAVRFSCQLNFNIDLKTQDAMEEFSSRLATTSMERIKDELNKSLRYNEKRTLSWIDILRIHPVLNHKGLRFELTNKL